MSPLSPTKIRTFGHPFSHYSVCFWLDVLAHGILAPRAIKTTIRHNNNCTSVFHIFPECHQCFLHTSPLVSLNDRSPSVVAIPWSDSLQLVLQHLRQRRRLKACHKAEDYSVIGLYLRTIHPGALASPAMGHWGTCPALDFQLVILGITRFTDSDESCAQSSVQ